MNKRKKENERKTPYHLESLTPVKLTPNINHYSGERLRLIRITGYSQAPVAYVYNSNYLEAEICRIVVQGQPRQSICETPEYGCVNLSSQKYWEA
jgi:hypothetical protein